MATDVRDIDRWKGGGNVVDTWRTRVWASVEKVVEGKKTGSDLETGDNVVWGMQIYAPKKPRMSVRGVRPEYMRPKTLDGGRDKNLNICVKTRDQAGKQNICVKTRDQAKPEYMRQNARLSDGQTKICASKREADGVGKGKRARVGAGRVVRARGKGGQ